MGEGPPLGPGGGKRETAVVGAVPEALRTPVSDLWHTPQPQALRMRLRPERRASCPNEWLTGLFLVQGRPHP